MHLLSFNFPRATRPLSTPNATISKEKKWAKRHRGFERRKAREEG